MQMPCSRLLRSRRPNIEITSDPNVTHSSPPGNAVTDGHGDAQHNEVADLIGWLDQQHEARSAALADKVHAELASTLTALTMRLALITRHAQGAADTISAEGSALLLQCQKAAALMTTLTATTREIQQALRPFAIESLGLFASLSDYLQQFGERLDIITSINLHGTLPDWPQSTAQSLLRMIEQALLNIELHAKARRVDIEIDCAAAQVTFVIVDDGDGFDVHKSDPRLTYGLRLMQMRAALLSGRCEVISFSNPSNATNNNNNANHSIRSLSGGCRVVITVPMAPSR